MNAISRPAPPAEGNALAVLLGLARRARQASGLSELRFIMANETIALVSYRQAFVWSAARGLETVSGVAAVEQGSPFTLWLDRALRGLTLTCGAVRQLDRAAIAPGIGEQWADFLPAHLLLLPLCSPDGALLGALGLAREQPWEGAEIVLLDALADAYAPVFAWHHRQSWPLRLLLAARRIRMLPLVVVLAVVAAGFLPVRLSVLAPGEIVPRDPAIIRAPLDGVVERVAVAMNAAVAEGDLLFELDTTTIRGQSAVAEKAFATAQAEYEQVAQQAFYDPKAKAQLGVLAGRIAERRAERAYLASVLERSRVRAPRAGIAVVDDPTEWAGRPVAVGERVMAVADERDTELEVWLPPQDLIALPEAAPATLFLNIDPLAPVHASLRYVAYESQPRPDGSLAYRLRATITDEVHPRLGYRGTVRLSGERVSLAYWLLRRPLAALRQKFGI
jgi:hypothetical protein